MTFRNRPALAISYNHEIGGPSADALRSLILNSGASLFDIDYYHILTAHENLSGIYNDPIKQQRVLAEAKTQARLVLQYADCLILPGIGGVVDPRLYDGELTKEQQSNTDLRRTIAEMALAHVAIEKGMPILALCGGHQLINVYFGGKLVDLDMDDLEANGYMSYGINQFSNDSELGKISFYPKDKREGEFFGAHHQVVDANHIGGKHLINGDDFLKVAAIAKNPSHNIEAMEANYGAPLYSLQFHPEVALAGMYSILFKRTTYFAPTKKSFNANFNIFKAFKTAADTYAHKKSVLKDINKVSANDENDDQNVPLAIEFMHNKTNYHSLFNEIKTKNPRDLHENEEMVTSPTLGSK